MTGSRRVSFSILVVFVALVITSLPSISASPPKAGSACAKQGLTKSYQDKKFTCIKSGKKLVWSKGVVTKQSASASTPSRSPTPNPSARETSSPEPTPTTSVASPTPTPAKEPTDSYVTASRARGNSAWAAALGPNSAVILREDANGLAGSKSFRVRIISPRKGGESFDSGLIKDFAENISFFVEGTICYVIYASEFISYRDVEGTNIAFSGRNAEAPRAESGECGPYDPNIKDRPISVPKKGIRVIYSDVTPENGLRIRLQGAEFKSFQISLESSLNSQVLWQSPITDSSSDEVSATVDKLSCDTRYGLRVKMWSEGRGQGTLLSDVRRHSFTSLPCKIESSLLGTPGVEGGPCIQVGKQVTNPQGILECRRIKNNQNAWALIEKESKVSLYGGKKESIETCKLRDARPQNQFHPLSQSFPRPDRFQPSTGVVDIALVGIDFKDAPGRGKPFDQEPDLQKNFDNWADFWSGGKLKWRWHELNEWTRVPGLSTEYNQKFANAADEQMANEVFTEVNKRLSLKDVEIVLIYFPESLLGTNNGYMPYKSVPVNLPFGTFSPYYWGGDPSVNERGPQNTSWYYYHEVLHGIGFSLHAPGNFFLLGPTNIEIQHGRDFGYGSPAYVDIWSGFVNGWYDERNIVCLDKKNLQSVEVQLESIDVNPKGQTSVMIKVSDKEMLVIESRRSGPYTNFPKGFAGVTVTKVDTSKIYARFDRSVDGLEWEMNQWSYYARVDQEKSPEWFVRPDTPSRILGYEGETFTIDGIQITIKKSATFDLVEVVRK